MNHTIELKNEQLTQPVPEKPFVHAMLFALNVLAGEAIFDTTDVDGIVVPDQPKTAPINAALLALQSTLGEFELDDGRRRDCEHGGRRLDQTRVRSL